MQGPHKLSLESYLVVGHLGRRKIKHDSTTWVIGLSIIMARLQDQRLWSVLAGACTDHMFTQHQRWCVYPHKSQAVLDKLDYNQVVACTENVSGMEWWNGILE